MYELFLKAIFCFQLTWTIFEAQASFTAILHYIFLSDPRTDRVVGEPRADNPAILKLSIQSIMNVNTVSTSHPLRNAAAHISTAIRLTL